MTSTKTIILLGTILTTIFSGCTHKKEPALACFKGSTSCLSQTVSDKEESCTNCVATIITFRKKATCTSESCHITLSNNHSI